MWQVCHELIEYGAYFVLNEWILTLKKDPIALFAFRIEAWNLRDFNCFRVLNEENLSHKYFLNQYYHPLAIQFFLQLGLNILELSNEMIRRIFNNIFLSEDYELLNLFFKNWDKQIPPTEKMDHFTVRGNQIIGVIVQKHKLMREDALVKLMNWLLSNKIISCEKRYYPYYINKSAYGNKTLIEIATLSDLPHSVRNILTNRRAVKKPLNIYKNSSGGQLFKNHHSSKKTSIVTNYIIALPAITLSSVPHHPRNLRSR